MRRGPEIKTLIWGGKQLWQQQAHNVFHVSLLKRYVHDPNHVINWDVIQVELEGEY